ncbi:hypothetical protein X772_20740 [Mesorhizobium sp. LSJC280B00]|nr:hypothetical protein X772_20740 [Mesorhizobium sp. LSJC280B00]
MAFAYDHKLPARLSAADRFRLRAELAQRLI